jgi:SAM-dependent methyltransferase
MEPPFHSDRSSPDRAAALAQYRRRARIYDLELALFEPVRRRAVSWLSPSPGATVLDVGCGTGLSFELLQSAVGPGGHIVGIEQSPEMIEHAQRRLALHGWRNVTLLCSPVESARLHVMADAALLHFTHDILQRDDALANLVRHLRPGACVVASGLKWAPPRASNRRSKVQPRRPPRAMTGRRPLPKPTRPVPFRRLKRRCKARRSSCGQGCRLSGRRIIERRWS